MTRQEVARGISTRMILATLAVMAFITWGDARAQQSNLALTLRESSAATTTVTLADQTNAQWTRAHVIVTTTGLSSGNFTPKVQGKDPVSGNYYDLVTGTTISGTGTVVLRVVPGASNTTGTVSDFLPKTWRVQLVGASTPIGTLSIGGFLAP